jgi:WD40 repeat protein/TPR repeat protein
MNCYLLVADPNDPAGSARALRLQLQILQTSPGGEDITISFRPNRSDDLHISAKESARLAYRILFREGIVRSQLVARLQLSQAPANVVGRSADLAFALAIFLQVYREMASETENEHSYPTIAATGVLEGDGAIRSVEHVPAKLNAVLREFPTTPATVFFPASNVKDINLSALRNERPDIELVPISHLDEALEHLGIVLERVYLRNPFRGLEHFDYQDHAIFFGRDSEIHSLVKQLLRREQMGTPGLLVEGPSGSGKSSFIRAGVLPTLVNPRHESLDVQNAMRVRPVSASVRSAIWRPGLMPVGVDELGMVRSIRVCWAGLSEWAIEWRGGQEVTLAELANNRRAYWPTPMRFVWVIDQLEEIHNLGLKNSLVEALGGFLAQMQSDGVWTLASIRADATSQLKRHGLLRQVFGANEGGYYLPTLQGLALEDVISLPARAAELTFGMTPDGKRLDQLLRQEAYLEQDTLPLLQFTLNELYLRRSGKQLTYAAYEQLRGLAGSIATTAAAILSAEDVESRAVPRLFRTLVSVDERNRASRRYAPMSEFAHDARQKNLVLRLVEARLCVTDQRDGESVVAFAHDSLLRTLPSLTEWLKEEGVLLQTRELAQHEARLWQQHGESAAWLAASDKVVLFKSLDAAEIALPPEVRQFIDRSQRQVRRATRVKQAVVGIIALLAVAASIGAWVATNKQREAEYQAAEARKAQLQLLTETATERLKDGDLIFARGIVLEVLKRRAASDAPDPAAVNVLQEIRANDPALAILAGHSAPVRRVTYSPDGSRILTASLDGTARIWDARTGNQLQVLPVHPHVPNTPGYADIVKTAVYSPDGQQIMTAAADNTTRVWNARTGAQVMVLAGHHEDLQSAAYSLDGTRIVTAARTGCEIWGAQTRARLADFAGADEDSQTAVFSPDGTRVVSAGRDGTARVWDAGTGRQLLVLAGHTSGVQSASYSPDGRRIVTSSKDNTVRIWDAHSGAQMMVLTGHLGEVWFASYSPDGKIIASAATDNTVRVWDASTGKSLRILSGHTAGVGSVAFSPDGRKLVSGGWDLTARTWELNEADDAVVISGHNGKLTSVALSPDGTQLLSASADGTARILDAHAGTPIVGLSEAGDIDLALFSPDGMRILTISDANGMRIWDARTGARLLSIPESHGAFSAVFSPDAARILTSFDDFSFEIRDASSGAPIKKSSAVHRDFITSAVYSPDATRILTASVDKTVRIWDAKSFAPLALLPHKNMVNQAAYSPDGELILTATSDSLAHVWDTRTGTEIRVLAGHHAPVASAAFSSDGDRIITGSRDDTVRVWDAHSGIQLAVLSAHGAMLGRHVSYSRDGSRIASVSADYNTARIWSATVPADWGSQVLWEQAVEADPLSEVQRTVLGIPSTQVLLANGALQASGARSSEPSTPAGKVWACSQYAGAYYDPDRITPGLEQASITADIAISACAKDAGADSSGQIIYQTGRARLAQDDFAGARREFESAVSKGYRAANVDLALLLSDPAAKMLDPKRAASLFAQAWKSGVPIAEFELAALYERGARSAEGSGPAFNPDVAKAWAMYEEAARRNEPNSLARLAERAEHGALAASGNTANALLLEAFTLYARAAERARTQAWPDGAWRAWRYRRATLARILAQEGMMREVARNYKSVLEETT